jgi:hypothetical protein
VSRLRSTTLSRTLRAAALAILVGASAVVPAPVAGATAAAVSWKTDDTAKIITATVRITITPACTPGQLAAARGPAAAARCHVTDEIARAIKENIEKVWNGHQYYCYDVVVKVDVKVDDTLNPPDPTDRVLVRIDQSPVYLRNFVSASEGAGATWDGNSPSDQLTPQNSGAGSSLWRYPAVRPGINTPNLYAHEAGHVMGVHDTYEDYVGSDGKVHSRPKAGAAVDVMNSTAAGNVDPATSNRLIERAGIKKTDLKCNYQIDHASMGGTITGRKCDAPGGTWIANGTYDVLASKGHQTWTIKLDATSATGAMTGTFTYTDDQVSTPGGGVTVYTKGKASGVVELTIDDQLKAHMNLRETEHSYTATTSKGGKGKAVGAPLASSELTWDPIGLCD